MDQIDSLQEELQMLASNKLVTIVAVSGIGLSASSCHGCSWIWLCLVEGLETSKHDDCNKTEFI